MKKYENLTPTEQELEKLYQIEAKNNWSITMCIPDQELTSAYYWCNRRGLRLQKMYTSNGHTYYLIYV